MFNFLKEISFLMPDFLNVQRSSFYQLLKTGIIEEFQKKNPILIRKKKIKIVFLPKYYQLTIPKWDLNQSIINAKTYAAHLHIPILYKLIIFHY